MTAPYQQAYYTLRAAQQYFNSAPAELSAEQQQWLAGTVERQLAMEAKVLHSPEAGSVVISDDSHRRAMEEVQSQYEDTEAFLDDLGDLGMSVSQLGDLLERQLRVEAVLELQSAAVEEASCEQARAYFDANPDKFFKPERRRARHLLITVNDEYAENTRDAVLERLAKIQFEVGKDLATFRKLARRHSECPSALSEGELGWIPRGHLYPEIDAALFAMEAGSLSAVIETEVGLHLIFCEAIEAASTVPFAEVEQTLRDKLTDAARRRAQREWLQQLG